MCNNEGMTKRNDHFRKSDLTPFAGGTLTITGNTFANKDAIKAAGGTWNKDAKAWIIDIPNGSGALTNLANLTFKIRQGCTFEATK